MAADWQPGKQIASGRTADIYEWGPGHIVKVYHSWVPVHDVEMEQRKAAIAGAGAIRTPAVGQIVQVDGKTGLVFERVQGQTMLAALFAGTHDLSDLARQMAELQLRLHAHTATELPPHPELLRARIGRAGALSAAERETVLATAAKLARTGALCHGDFHPANIIVTDRGPQLIDWIDAYDGDPVSDVARTSLLLLGHAATGAVDRQLSDAINAFHECYLDHYFDGDTDRMRVYRQWLKIMAAARLAEGIVEQEEWLLGQVRGQRRQWLQP